MKSLKTILEGVLSDIDTTIKDGDIMANNVLRNELNNYIKNKYPGLSNVSPIIEDDNFFEKVKLCCMQVEDTAKKGSQWRLVLPSKNATFAPFYMTLKKGLYRYSKGADKETYGTTASAMHKRLVSKSKFAKKFGISNGWIQGYKSLWEFSFFINEYELVDSFSGDNWYTYVILRHGLHNNEVLYISINTDTKQWAYGINSNVPKFAFNGNDISRDFITASETLYRINADGSTVGGTDKACVINSLKHGNVVDYKKSKNDWVSIHFLWNDHNIRANGRSDENTLYIHKTNFVYLTHSDIFGNGSNNTISTRRTNKTPQEEIESIRGKLGIQSLSDAAVDYIYANYTKVTNAAAVQGKTWNKVYRAGNDAKYGSFMICIDTKEWRTRSFDEFYGGGIVD